MEFFALAKDEEIIKEIKPLKGLILYFTLKNFLPFLSTSFGIIIILGFMFTWVFMSASPSLIGFWFSSAFLIFLCTLALLCTLVLTFLYAKLRYKHEYYWITNKRIICKTGLIGYRVWSTPLERISDIIISRDFLERMLGLESLHIQTLAGQLTPGRRIGSEVSLLAISEAEKVQKLISELIKRKRKEEHITF